jgi:hypothetical protein
MLVPMPRNGMTRKEMECRVLKLKHMLYNGNYQHKNGDFHDGAHEMLNKVLNIIEEYRY